MQIRSFSSLMESYERLIARPNPANEHFYNGLYTRYRYPVLTREHIPPFWMYDADPASNPFMMQRLGVNATMNSGAIKLNGKYCLVVRVEGMDRKSFFAVAESDKPTEGFRFRDYPVVLPDTCAEETNVYDMRLTQHEDGWIYGVFCSESKDHTSSDLSAAVAAAGIVRTKDLQSWERLPNLKTLRSPQQRNVVLHPEFVDGQYAFYTRPMDDFIETGSGGGIGFGLCKDIEHPVIDEEKIISLRRYHTITEAKNGEGATPIKTEKGWLHIAHGVRNTAAGLRYVIYVFVTALDDPSKVIAEPSGFLIAPRDWERVGDVSNVVFTNGAIADDDGSVYIYYAASDTRLHVASTTIDKLLDFAFNTPADPLRSVDCVKQRCALIDKNLEYLKSIGGLEVMHQRNIEKAKVIYDFLDSSKMFHGTVEPEFRSLMNIPFVTDSAELDAEVVAATKAAGYDNLKGHKSVGGLRASVYNAMPIEGAQALVEFLKKFEAEHTK